MIVFSSTHYIAFTYSALSEQFKRIGGEEGERGRGRRDGKEGGYKENKAEQSSRSRKGRSGKPKSEDEERG